MDVAKECCFCNPSIMANWIFHLVSKRIELFVIFRNSDATNVPNTSRESCPQEERIEDSLDDFLSLSCSWATIF